MFLSSCVIHHNNDRLIFVKSSMFNTFSSIKLKTNGYYYFSGHNPTKYYTPYPYKEKKVLENEYDFIKPILLYSDGTIGDLPMFTNQIPVVKNKNQGLVVDSIYKTPFTNFQYFLNTLDEQKDRIIEWGCYEIKDDTIRYRKFIPENVGTVIPAITFNVYEFVGIILSDTSFKIFEQYPIDNHKDILQLNRIYYFKQYPIKPNPKVCNK